MKLATLTEPNRHFITREFAETLSGKSPQAYLRRHDCVQDYLASLIEQRSGGPAPWNLFVERAVHFFRELSLFQLPRVGRGLDECCALALEAGFDLAQADGAWLTAFAEDGAIEEADFQPLYALDCHWRRHDASHTGLCEAITDFHAPKRERGEIAQDELVVLHAAERWFRAGAAAASYCGESEAIRRLAGVFRELSVGSWGDSRLHTKLIRTAPVKSPITAKADLLAHPLLRLSANQHRNHPAEHLLAAEFLHAQCIIAGFESEEDFFGSDLVLASWVRDARTFAERVRREDVARLKPVFRQAGRKALRQERSFLYRTLGEDPGSLDCIELTQRLIAWRQSVRGTRVSQTRGEIFEVIVHCVHVALWVGWLWPEAGRK